MFILFSFYIIYIYLFNALMFDLIDMFFNNFFYDKIAPNKSPFNKIVDIDSNFQSFYFYHYTLKIPIFFVMWS